MGDCGHDNTMYFGSSDEKVVLDTRISKVTLSGSVE